MGVGFITPLVIPCIYHICFLFPRRRFWLEFLAPSLWQLSHSSCLLWSRSACIRIVSNDDISSFLR